MVGVTRRYRLGMQMLMDFGVLVDARNTSRADALWEDGHLYMVSAGTEASLDKDSARFLRYSYDPSTARYSLDKGFPVTITEGGMEAITLAKDTTGKLWATYTQGDELRRVFVTHTSGKDDSSWVKPFVLPLRGTTVSSDDTWRQDNPVIGAGMANDHINLKADSEGRVFATLKTRRDRIDRDLDAPYSMLWVRDEDGNWTSHVFGTVGDSHTRSLALIDEEKRLLYMFASSPTCTGGIGQKPWLLLQPDRPPQPGEAVSARSSHKNRHSVLRGAGASAVEGDPLVSDTPGTLFAAEPTLTDHLQGWTHRPELPWTPYRAGHSRWYLDHGTRARAHGLRRHHPGVGLTLLRGPFGHPRRAPLPRGNRVPPIYPQPLPQGPGDL